MKKILGLGAAILLILTACSFNPEIKAAKELTKRVIPEQASHFEFVHLDDTLDRFTLESKGKKIVIGGNNANSMAFGLNYYLKNYCLTTVSWNVNEPLYMPKSLPKVPEKVSASAKVQDRFFLNYCTYGYTMPWWGWKEWSWMIDWMALNGVTQPLNITGEEAVLMKVWEKFGLSQDDIRESFTGPPFLPWNRMMDIDKWKGPLPQKFIDRQEKLQRQILKRERELDMKPVLPAFNGKVPAAFAKHYPDAHVKEVTKWDGFEAEYGCWFLDPGDPLFAEIQKVFIEEQTKMYGTSHVYGLDIFNEVDFFEGNGGDNWDPKVLARISHHVYETLEAADPEAVWLQVGWMLYYDQKHWSQENVKAYLNAVPQGKVAMLDYFCDEAEIYKLNDNFYGQPYYFCFLGNFGGNTNLSGDFHSLSSRISDALTKGGDNLLGLGGTLEGFGVSQWMYEYVLDRAWDLNQDDTKWLETLAYRHVGKKDDTIAKAWKELSDNIYTKATYSGICPIACIHPCLEGHWRWTTVPDVPYTFEQISSVWAKLLESPAETDFYKFDIVNIGSEVIKLAFPKERDAFTQCYYNRDLEGLKRHAQNMRELYDMWEELLSCHPAFSFKNWLDSARQWGDTPEEKDYYENCARVIVTSWGGTGQLTDYANRQWSGLVHNYYRQRWEMFWDEIIADVDGSGPKFDQTAFDAKIREFELDFGEVSHPLEWKESKEDAYSTACRIASALGIANSDKVSIVPQPKVLRTTEGKVELGENPSIFFEDKDWAYLLKGFNALNEKYGARTWTKASSENKTLLCIKLDETREKEGYILESTPSEGKITVRVSGRQGAWNALMTVLQLTAQNPRAIRGLHIEDAPAFAYRGTHLDVCRHFFNIQEVKDYIDILALHKINTFHWHLTDDQGWRLEIKKYPELTKIGSMRKETLIGPLYAHIGYDGIPYGGYYTQEEAKEIVRYAQERGITVIPEIEMPGHAKAALASYPELGCKGKDFDYEVWTSWGVNADLFCAGKEETFKFLEDVLDEVCKIFPSEYIHIGGDEARKTEWEKCPNCQQRIKDEGFKNEKELQSYFIRRIENYLNTKGRKIIGWDEILEGGVTKTATVMSWRGTKGGIEAAKIGNDVIMTPSSYFYLDYYQTKNYKANGEPLAIGGHLPLRTCYSFDPFDQLTEDEKVYIKGIQCNLWTEYIPDYKQVQHMLLPRLAALSEVAWSNENRTSYDDFVDRIKISLLPLYEKAGYNFATYAFQNPPLE